MRDRLEEASGKAMSRRTEMAYKAQSPGKLAFMPFFGVQHNEAPDSGDRVNAAVCARRKCPWGIATVHVLTPLKGVLY